MSSHHEARNREECAMTAAAERATGQFHCASSNHFATGAPVVVRGRKMCQACAAKRRRQLAALKGERKA